MPLTINFTGEFLILYYLLMSKQIFAYLFLLFTSFLCTIYSIWLYNRMFFGSVNKKQVYMYDLRRFELCIILPIVSSIVILGFFPNILLHFFIQDISTILVATNTTVVELPNTTVVELLTTHTDLACKKKQAADVWNWSSVLSSIWISIVNFISNPIGCIKYYINHKHHSNSYGKGAFEQHQRLLRYAEMQDAIKYRRIQLKYTVNTFQQTPTTPKDVSFTYLCIFCKAYESVQSDLALGQQLTEMLNSSQVSSEDILAKEASERYDYLYTDNRNTRVVQIGPYKHRFRVPIEYLADLD